MFHFGYAFRAIGQIFRPPKPVGSAHTPGAYVSAKSGDWNTPSTWVANAVPIVGDTATIANGHVVTISTGSVTIGTSPAAGSTAAITVASGGTLTQTGGQCYIFGDVALPGSNTVRGWKVLGGTVIFDTTALYTIKLPSQYPANQPVMLIQGTQASRVTFKSANGTKPVRFIGSGANYYGILESYFCDFQYIGDSSHAGWSPSINSDSGFDPSGVWIAQDCTFDSTGGIDLTAVTLNTTAKFQMLRCPFTNTVGASPLTYTSYGSKTGVNSLREIKDCYFDKQINLYSPQDLTLHRNYITNGWVTTGTDKTGWASCDNNLIELTSEAFGDCNVNGQTFNNNVIVGSKATAVNQHYMQVGTYASVGTYTCSGNIFDGNMTDGQGDCFTIAAAASAITINLDHNIVNKNNGSDNTGTLFSQLGNANVTLNVTHNTYYTGTQGAAGGETYPGYPGMYTGFESNIAWDDQVGRGLKFYDSGTNDSVTDLITSGHCDFNAGFNLKAGSNLKGYDHLEFSSGSPGAHDVDGDPQFVSTAVKLKDWDASLGGPGTMAGALARLKSNVTQIAAYTTFCRAGMSPQNAALDNTGHDGQDIGAVAVSAGSTATPQAVPRKTEWLTAMKYWVGDLKTFLAANHPYNDSKLDWVYYDGTNCGFRMADLTGDTATWYPQADEGLYYYRDGYVIPNNGGASGFQVFSMGLVQDFNRRGSTTSKNAALSLLTNAAYGANGQSDLTDDLFSRENAYSLLSKIHCPRMSGVTLTAAQITLRDQEMANALSHIDQWSPDGTNPGVADYFRPFMGGLTARALIDYYLYVNPSSGTKTTIVTKLTNLANYAWNSCWVPASGTNAGAFKYTDRNVGNSLDNYPQWDLNMLVAPLFGFLFNRTGDATWRQKGDQIFTGSIPVYSTDGFWQTGSYMGYNNANGNQPSGKQIDQQLFWGPLYIQWSEAIPLTTITGS